MEYRPDIDGLRAIAILPVVFYHTGLVSGGYVGVDIFFVISGYLITLIIAKDIKLAQFSIVDFYERRVRRIFPALFTVIFFCSATATIVMHGQGYKEFGKSIVAATLFLANILFWNEVGYFDAEAETKPLLHIWSLSIEEQFYLFYPLILVLAYKWLRQRWVLLVLLLAAISLAANILLLEQYPSTAFYFFSSRAWELLIGALLALGFFPALNSPRIRDLASVLGLVLIGWAVFGFTQKTPYPGINAIIPCLGAALIIYTGIRDTSLAGRLLSHRVLVFTGLISYSLYLWHWPLIVFASQLYLNSSSLIFSGVIIALSVALAAFSWRFIEQPFRRKTVLAQRKQLFSVALGVMIMSILVGYCINQIKIPTEQEANTERLSTDPAKSLSPVHFSYDKKKYNEGSCFLDGYQDHTEWQEASCFIQNGKTANTLLWGDSFAAHYIPGIKNNLHLIDSNVLQYTASGCAPVFNYYPSIRPMCRGFSSQVNRIISDYKIQTVILAAGWALAAEQGMKDDDLRDTVEQLRNQGLRVILIGQSPWFDQGVQDIYNRTLKKGVQTARAKVPINLPYINALLKEYTGSGEFINPADFFCEGQMCRFKDDKRFFFWDFGHYTDYGSNRVVEYLFKELNI